MPLPTNGPVLRAAQFDVTWRFLKAFCVYGACNPGAMGCLFVRKLLVNPIISLEAATQEMLSRDCNRNVAVNQNVERSIEVSSSFSTECGGKLARFAAFIPCRPKKVRRRCNLLVDQYIKLVRNWKNEPKVVYK
jgi:hypothetical protein